MSRLLIVTAAAALLVALPVTAGAEEGGVKRAADATVHGLEKGQDAVVHVARAGVSGATKGVHKAGGAVTHVAKKVGLPTEQGNPPQITPKTE